MASFSDLEKYKLTEVEITDTLGRGSYADVFELKYMGLKCAGKRINHLLLQEEKDTESYVVRRFQEECHLLSQVRHPNIVQFLGVYFEKSKKIPILVLEYLPTNLTLCITKYDFLPKEICYSILYDIALGLNYLHCQDPPIIHCNLSSNNILLTPNMTAKISDLSKMLNLNQQTRNSMTYTLVFMPPELNVFAPDYNTSVDEFAYGVIIIHLLSRELPQPQLGEKYIDSNSRRMIPVSELDRRRKFIDKIERDHPLMMLIEKCLADDPLKRARANEMVEHLAPLVSDQLCQLDVLKCIETNERALKEEQQRNDNETSTRMNEVEQLLLESKGQLQQLKEGHLMKMKELEQRKKTFEEEFLTLSAHKQSIAEKLQKQKEHFSTTLRILKDMQQIIEDIDIQETSEECPSAVMSASPKSDDKEMCETGESTPKPTDQPDSIGLPSEDQQPMSKSPGNSKQHPRGSKLHKSKGSRSSSTLNRFKLRSPYKKSKSSIEKHSDTNPLSGVSGCSNNMQEPAELVESSKNTVLYVGRFDYQACEDCELSFRKGDVMKIMNKDGEWWYARLERSNQEGYVPSNFIAEHNSLLDEEWFFGKLEHSQAKLLLMKPGNLSGSYLVCENAAKFGTYTLFVRDNENIINYPILQQEDQDYYVAPMSSTFTLIKDLITHIEEQDEELEVKLNLKYPCIRFELDKNEIDRKQLKVLDGTVTSEEFGEVRRGLLKTTSVAVKVFNATQDSHCRYFLHEAHVLQKFEHPNIIRLLGVCTRGTPFCIVTEYSKEGNLVDYLNSGEGKSRLEPQLIRMAVQIASGMLKLEEANCVHRNLSAQNILVGDNLVCKVSNFHYALENNTKHSYLDHIKSPVKWAAPEVLMNQLFSSKSDVWSFGIVLHELITQGQMPYPDMADEQVEQKVINESYRMPCPRDCPSKLYSIMRCCWDKELTKRPTFANLQLELDNYYSLKDE